MKRLVSVVLVLTMMLSVCPAISAATISDKTTLVPNPMDLGLFVSVGARKSGTSDAFAYPADGVFETELDDDDKAFVDYQSKLDMSIVRELFDGSLIDRVLDDDEAEAEFLAGEVTTEINVVINYPAAAKFNMNLASSTTGVLDAGGIFREKSRTSGLDQGYTYLKITYVNDPVKVDVLKANLNTYLKDITFTLEDAVEYNRVGNHIVSVTLSGSSTIKFASKTQKVNYYNYSEASVITKVTKDNSQLNEHYLVVKKPQPATCFEDGYTESIYCETHQSYDGECATEGARAPEVIPKLNHMLNGISTKSRVEAIVSTCSVQGYPEHYTCSLCNMDFDSAASDEAHPHSYYEAMSPMRAHTKRTTPAVPATCTTTGFDSGTMCTECNKILDAQEVIPATGHKDEKIPGYDATCTTPGKTDGVACETCQKVLIPQQDIPATGHNFGEWIIERPATETENGLMRRECTNPDCNEFEEKSIEKTEHVCSPNLNLSVTTKVPTCTETGLVQHYCLCGNPVGAPQVLPAKGHTMKYITGIPATCMTYGIIEHWLCVECNTDFRDPDAEYKLNTVIIAKDKNNHGGNIIDIQETPSTCTTYGISAGKKCRNCGFITEKQHILDTLAPHIKVEVAGVAPTCEQAGVIAHVHCKICGLDYDAQGHEVLDEHQFDLPALGHEYSEPQKGNQFTENGEVVWEAKKTCTREGCNNTINYTIKLNQDNCDHRVKLEAIDKDPTCTEKGHEEIICMICGKTLGEKELPKIGHDTGDAIPAVPSTCYREGTDAYYQCKVCGKYFDGEDAAKEIPEPKKLEKTSHDFREIGNGNNLQCMLCHEVVHVKKTDKKGKFEGETGYSDIGVSVDTSNPNLNVNVKEVIVDENDNLDLHKEKVLEESTKIEFKTEVEICAKNDLSTRLNTTIKGSEKADSEKAKAAWDIDIVRTTTYPNGDFDKQALDELDGVIEITIKIPAELQGAVDYIVYRMHGSATGTITTAKNADGEYIVIDSTNDVVKLYVKKFSEYALVAYNEKVNKEDTPVGGGGVGESSFTVTFELNGGTGVESVSVKANEKLEVSDPRKKGHIFKGWYTDESLTEKFDFDSAITKNIKLYAKWIKDTEIVGEECTGVTSGVCSIPLFYDLDPYQWYHLGCDYVIENKLMIGVATEKFAPLQNITRGMIATILGRREGVADFTDTYKPFDDVISGEYYTSHIAWAAENGVVLGYGDGNYGPEDPITREQMAAIIHRYFKYLNIEFEGEMEEIPYVDADQIQDYALEAVKFCYNMGIMVGKDASVFDPAGHATRAEVAVLIMRTFNK